MEEPALGFAPSTPACYFQTLAETTRLRIRRFQRRRDEPSSDRD